MSKQPQNKVIRQESTITSPETSSSDPPSLSETEVTQRQLSSIIRLRARAKVIAKELELVKAELADIETVVMLRLGHGMPVEPGPFTALVQQGVGRCTPPWKDVYLHHMVTVHEMSEKSAELTIRESYPPGSTTTLIVNDTRIPRSSK